MCEVYISIPPSVIREEFLATDCGKYIGYLSLVSL